MILVRSPLGYFPPCLRRGCRAALIGEMMGPGGIGEDGRGYDAGIGREMLQGIGKSRWRVSEENDTGIGRGKVQGFREERSRD